MKIAVFLNPTKPGALEYTRVAIDELLGFGAEVLLFAQYAKNFQSSNIIFFENIDKMLTRCDVLLTIGGDGTIIHCAKHALQAGKPILGVNLGRLGFVATLEKDDLGMLELLAKGQYAVEPRTVLEVSTQNQNFFAVNEAVISRLSSQLIDVEVWENSEKIAAYRADGLIFATALGSTAYSFSAGGPVLDPALDCLLMTPICSHTLFSRPVVFSSKTKLESRINSIKNSEPALVIDGAEVCKISFEERLKVSVSSQKIKFISFERENFCKKIPQNFF